MTTVQRIRKAVLPSGGLATRLLPLTKVVPKELMPVVDRPVVEYLLDEICRAGLSSALFVTVRGKSAIDDHLDREPEHRIDAQTAATTALIDRLTIQFVRQGGPLGMGHAVLRAADHIGAEPFAVVTGDELVDPDENLIGHMVDVHAELGGVVLAVREVPEALLPLSDVVSATEVDGGLVRVTDIAKRPSGVQAPSSLALVGRYLLPSEIFDAIRTTRADDGGEVQLPDAIVALGRRGVPIHAVRYTGERYDVATKLGLIQSSICLALQHPQFGEELRGWLTTLTASNVTMLASEH